ncbi:MAG: Vacuolar H+transporting two-sector ATPase F subunit [Gammaproteobacteria bacterium]|nr:Vacuolar H+transporting two-sector ATPase F subunit [Gammaproteobacteria bacterium]NIR85639.1 Vacuolar H+transporting two-sector ATPase F subunit [Gammaproteobacteria bacterium]NIR90127.1 Vacuolar H+transporting two-sector ATPase F subunit [Gammaproteobacteria bacterium]NIU06773.1 Vacuolar H+transporting two-sector ATPase F subunit [Gammaproteobacteria bacterium]NIV53706.1 Vacuolar H+transporting two-sector ATPase F subunit [Gammaproteobacteria bacterium]
MSAPVFIGDEVTATGFRLAGAHVVVPEADAVSEALERARAEAELVLITAACAQALPPAALRRALRAVHPMLVVVPDVRGEVVVPDLEARTRRVLGLET